MAWTKRAVDIWKDFVTAGNPSSGAYKPKKSEIRTLVTEIEQNIETLNGVAGFPGSAASIQADTLATVRAGVPPESDTLNELHNQVRVSDGIAKYTGGQAVRPIVTDSNLDIVLGYDSGSGKMVGLFDVEVAPTALVPLTSPINTTLKLQFVFYGQSLAVGVNSTPALSTAQYLNRMFIEGTIPGTSSNAGLAITDFGPFVNMREETQESPVTAAANYWRSRAMLRNVPDFRILGSTAALGGADIALLTKTGGTIYNSRFKQHVQAAQTVDPVYKVFAACYIQGEADTNPEFLTPKATYKAHLESIQSDFQTDAKAITGQTQNIPMVLAQTNKASKTWDRVSLGQLELCQQNDDKFFLATPLYHIPHHTDGLHLSAIGSRIVGAYFGRAMDILHAGYRPNWLNPRLATNRVGLGIVTIYFDVPNPPLAIDTTVVPLTTNYGFKAIDDNGAVAISSVAVARDRVQLTLAAVPVGTLRIRYGLDYTGAGMLIGLVDGGSGNLRDSNHETINVSGTLYGLQNWCPQFELTSTPIAE